MTDVDPPPLRSVRFRHLETVLPLNARGSVELSWLTQTWSWSRVIRWVGMAVNVMRWKCGPHSSMRWSACYQPTPSCITITSERVVLARRLFARSKSGAA